MLTFTCENNGLLVIECDISALPQRWAGDWQSEPVTNLQAVKLAMSLEECSTTPDIARYLLNTTINAKSWLIGKDPDAGRDWGQEEKGTTEDEKIGWHHRLDAHEFGWTLGVGVRQGGLVCCNSWGRKESDTTEQLNWRATQISFGNFQQPEKALDGLS